VIWVGEVDAIVGQARVDVVGHGPQPVFEELPRCASIHLIDQLGDGELARAVNADEYVELAFGSVHLADVDTEQADGIAFEALALRPVAFDAK
jgi:hypothetical protein